MALEAVSTCRENRSCIRVELYVSNHNQRECRFRVVVANFGEDWVGEIERRGIDWRHGGVVRWFISSSSVERGVNYELDRLWLRG
jgi:hypothetical protein